MNIISFDIEEWFYEKEFFGNRAECYQRFNHFLDKIFYALDASKTKATFFCVGKMAVDFPDVVLRIYSHGHEIGCHSNMHRWLNKMTFEEALADTREAVDSLEQLIGKKVKSYRAPAFSIGAGNKWAFEVLAKCGIERDASVFPAVRDFGGFAEFGQKEPAIVKCGDFSIKEFPICTAKIMGKDVAYSGGGYFRFFPYWFIKREMSKHDYSMNYFHIADLLPETGKVLSKEAYENYFKEPGSFVNRYKRYIKTNLGKKSAWNKLEKLISSTDYVNLEQADSAIDWTKAKVVEL